MRILHISDLHLKEPLGIKSNSILERFNEIIYINANEKRFDEIVISGDIRDSTGGINARNAAAVIERIALSAKLSDMQCVHIVPGNHDLERGESDRISDIRRGYDYANGTFKDPKSDLQYMLERFNGFFFNLCRELYGDVSPWGIQQGNPHCISIHEDYALILLNSSMCCISNDNDGNLIIGTSYIKQLIDDYEKNVRSVIFIAHHPMQNLANPEDTAFTELLSTYADTQFYWMCGDAHNNRQSPREHVSLYQVGSLTISNDSIPDFAIYDIDDGYFGRKVFRFIDHLNRPAKNGAKSGGWKRVYIDPKAPSLYYDETLD